MTASRTDDGKGEKDMETKNDKVEEGDANVGLKKETSNKSRNDVIFLNFIVYKTLINFEI